MKRAFTLSEVLITLGIIGIIAAMTLPSLIGNYRRKEVETRLKRAYSLLNQALLSASVKYGEPKDWPDWNSPEKIVNNYIAPEFNTLKVYPPSTDKYYTGMCWNLFFFILSQNTIKPYGYGFTLDRLSGTNQGACNTKAPSGGYLCAAKIMKEGWNITYW